MDTIIWLDGHTSLFQQVLEERDRLNVSATYITLVHMEILVISKSSSN